MVETNPLKWFIREIDIGDSGVKGSPGGAKVPPAGSGFQPGGGQRSSQAADKPNMFGHRIVRTRSRHDCHFATGASVPMGKQNHFSRACTVEDSTLFCFFSLFVCLQFSFFGLCVQHLFRVGTIAILLLEPVCRWVNKSILPEHAHWEIIPFLVSLFFWFVHQNPLPCP